jgi:hypothetical protein
MAEQPTLLAYAGTVPFIACAAVSIVQPDLPVALSPIVMSAAWALTICAFMAGVHWGQYLAGTRGPDINLLVTSNAIAIAGWLAYLLLPGSASLVVFAGLFTVLLAIDARLRKVGHIERNYWTTRMGVTAIVVASLLVTAAIA